METLASFKKAHGIVSLEFHQGKGRAIATATSQLVNTQVQVVVSSSFKTEQPAFIKPLTKEGTEEAIPNVYLLVNSEMKSVFTL